MVGSSYRVDKHTWVLKIKGGQKVGIPSNVEIISCVAFSIKIHKDNYCDGLYGHRVHNCYTATPQYFEHFRPRGSMKSISDISNISEGWNDHDVSVNIRLSARVNLERLIDGEQPVDQYPDANEDQISDSF